MIISFGNGAVMAESGGATVAGLRRMSVRYVVILRTVTVLVAGGAALVQATDAQRPVVAIVVTGLIGWTIGYVRFAPAPWVLVADTLVVVALCVAEGVLVRPVALHDSTNWVLAIVAITAVGHQWFTGVAAGALLTTVLVAAHLVGNVIAAPQLWAVTVPLGLWTFGEAALSRVLYVLVYTGARRADETVAARERATRDAEIAAARRADEREHLAVLHDTAAATLLAVSTRMVDGTEPWVAAQAARDVEILASQPERDGEADLARLLREVAVLAPVDVTTDLPETLNVPARVAHAASAAAREALRNVVRHAGVDTAALAATHSDRTVTVQIVDQGRGFVPDRVSAHRRGISDSIERRMADAGGCAVVTTAPDCGTTVRLEWMDE